MIEDIVIITGPTAVGKSDLAVELAKELDAEIISADSMQIYKELNIGSGKITEAEKKNVPHHLLDIRSFNEQYSVAEFCEDCKKKIREISARGKNVIIVGGTGLYIKALVNNYDYSSVQKNEEFRAKLEAEAQENGLSALYSQLKELSPERAEKISQSDKKRIIRALEILSCEKNSVAPSAAEFSYKIFALNLERDVLYSKINARVDKMFELGLLNEVQALKNAGMTQNDQSAKGIGYMELLKYLNGECSLDEAKEKIKQHSRNYAKRQLTLLRGMDVLWVNASDKIAAKNCILEKIYE